MHIRSGSRMKNQWDEAGIALGVRYHPPDVPLPPLKAHPALTVAA